MERTLNLLGRPTSIVDHDHSQYLHDLPTEFEYDTLSLFAAFCGRQANVLDLGAKIGVTTIALARLCPLGRVFALEASTRACAFLSENASRAGLANVYCSNLSIAGSWPVPQAAGDKPSMRAATPRSPGVTSIDPPDAPTVGPTCSVDDYVDRTNVWRFDLIRLGLEGYELDALRGARQTLRLYRPVVLCDVNHWCLNVFRRMALPDFLEEMFTLVPHVYAVNANLEFLDLNDEKSRDRFYRDHTRQFDFMNLVGGFDERELLARLNCLAMFHHWELERSALVMERDAYRNSRSWRYAAPLRKLAAWKRRYLPRAA